MKPATHTHPHTHTQQHSEESSTNFFAKTWEQKSASIHRGNINHIFLSCALYLSSSSCLVFAFKETAPSLSAGGRTHQRRQQVRGVKHNARTSCCVRASWIKPVGVLKNSAKLKVGAYTHTHIYLMPLTTSVCLPVGDWNRQWASESG